MEIFGRYYFKQTSLIPCLNVIGLLNGLQQNTKPDPDPEHLPDPDTAIQVYIWQFMGVICYCLDCNNYPVQ